MARLQPGVSIEQANAALLPASMPIVRDTVPDAGWIARAEESLHLFSQPGSRGFTYLRSYFRKPLVAVFAMCGGILLLACLNLASLLMARSAARERELATRMALGASRRRLIQQLLVESLLVAAAGSVLGLAIAPVVSKALATMLIGNNSRGSHRHRHIPRHPRICICRDHHHICGNADRPSSCIASNVRQFE